MKKISLIFLLLSVIMTVFSSCERKCVCKNLEDGSEATIYSAYSKKECREYEDYYNDLFDSDTFECTYK